MNTNLFFLEIFLGIWAEWMGNLDWMKSTNQQINKEIQNQNNGISEINHV